MNKVERRDQTTPPEGQCSGVRRDLEHKKCCSGGPDRPATGLGAAVVGDGGLIEAEAGQGVGVRPAGATQVLNL